MTFKEFWTNFTRIEKKLTNAQINEVQEIIDRLEAKKIPSSKIITVLQQKFSELSERYAAERAYWTESKKKETEIIFDNAEDLKLKTFRIINTPGACKKCREVSGHGDKRFKSADIQKDGKTIVPIHPNCYCLLLAID